MDDDLERLRMERDEGRITAAMYEEERANCALAAYSADVTEVESRARVGGQGALASAAAVVVVAPISAKASADAEPAAVVAPVEECHHRRADRADARGERASRRAAAARPASQQRAVATFAYKAEAADELSFAAGDVLQVEPSADKWWAATLDGASGKVPANYLKLDKGDGAAARGSRRWTTIWSAFGWSGTKGGSPPRCTRRSGGARLLRTRRRRRRRPTW